MARLFIKHKPVDVQVLPSSMTKFTFYLNGKTYAEIDTCYVCFVHLGNCWAARRSHYSVMTKQTSFTCVPFNDDPSGQEMILADMILN